LPNCVGYATGRFNEIGGYQAIRYLGSANAKDFIQFASYQGLEVTQSPTIGACIVWSGGDSSYGHVAIVEDIINETEIVISESGWSASKIWWTSTHYKGKSGNWTEGGDYNWMKEKY